MVRCLCCVVIVRVGFSVFECVSTRALLCDVVRFAFRCVIVLMGVCVLCLVSLHAVCELSCDDAWCSRCFCVCVFAVCVCVVRLWFIV